MYRAVRTYIKPGHRLYDYCTEMALASARLYNRANFIVRQYATAMDDFEKYTPLHSNQMEVYSLVKRITSGTKYEPPGKWIAYNTLDYLLKTTCDEAYFCMPAQSNQQILRILMRDYKSFFKSVKRYDTHPENYTGYPKLPGYCKPGEYKTAVLTNQICRIMDRHLVKFPGTKTKLNLGKDAFGTLKEVRIVPEGDVFVIETVLSCPDEGIAIPQKVSEYNDALLDELSGYTDISDTRIVAIDPGVDNLCAMTNNFGEQPLLIKGTMLKSANHYYNKRLAALKSMAELCNNRNSTDRIQRLTRKRNAIISDMLHKISRYITDYCKDHNVDIVVFGHNHGQKQRISIGTSNNQNFVQLPFEKLIRKLRYKLAEAGIRLAVTEESYTSKADYLAMDAIPVYKEGADAKCTFSGKRIARGLYRHYDGSISNADINGSANIMRKVFPKVTQWDRGVVDTPCAVCIA
jgi:putative transposase